MKPPMNQKITVHMPVLDSNGSPVKDKYGKAKTKEKHSKARVQFKSQLVKDAMGQEHEINLEIDLPPDCNPADGVKIEGKDAGGNTFAGKIKTKEDIINLTGAKVHYRTVFVDGR